MSLNNYTEAKWKEYMPSYLTFQWSPPIQMFKFLRKSSFRRGKKIVPAQKREHIVIGPKSTEDSLPHGSLLLQNALFQYLTRLKSVLISEVIFEIIKSINEQMFCYFVWVSRIISIRVKFLVYWMRDTDAGDRYNTFEFVCVCVCSLIESSRRNYYLTSSSHVCIW